MRKRTAIPLSLALLLCLGLTACTPAAEDESTPSAEFSTELPTETPHESVPPEPPLIEPPIFLEAGERPMIIAEVLETTGENAVLWDTEHTRVDCRLVYGYNAVLYRYSSRVSEQGEFALYLTDDALRQLGQAEMLLLCSLNYPYYPYEGYAADSIIPIVDGRMVLEEEWLYRLPVYAINDEIQSLADKRAHGEELSEAELLAPTAPLKDGMTVEEIITFLNTWRSYCNRASADFIARKAELYS